VSVYELTLSIARLREVLARRGVALTDDVTVRLVADPAAGTLIAELATDPRVAAAVSEIQTGQYL
jgi:hypothetical protein